MSVQLVGDWAAHFAFVGALLFSVGYGVFAPWWRSSLGANMFLFSLSHSLIFGLISVSLLFGVQWGARDWVRLSIYTVIAVLFWQRLMVLVRLQVIERHDDRESRRLGAVRRACRHCGK